MSSTHPRFLPRAGLLLLLGVLALPPVVSATDTWSPFDPGPLMDHTLTMDPVRSQAVVFGGWDGYIFNPSSTHNDSWSLDLAVAPAWHRLLPSGALPPSRLEHVAVLDPTRDRILVFGGKNNLIYFNDLWSLDLTGSKAWTQLAPAGTGPSPMETRAVYDPLRDRMILFGGYRPSTYLNELWQLSLTGTPTWSPLVATGTPPPARAAHTMIYDPVGDRVIVFGGLGGPGYMNDVWQLSLSGTPTWTHLAISGTPPIGRYGHSAIYDPLRLRMVVFGGYDGASNKLFNDVWALDLMSLTWSPMTVSGTLPLSATPIARDFTAMAYDAAHDRIVMHGGNRETLTPNGAFIGQTQVGGDLWMLDLEDLHTPVLVSTVESEAGPDLVRLRWHVSELDRSFDVMRSGSDGGWRARASLRPGSGGFLSYEDTDIQPGATYSYRLQFEDEGSVRYAGETRIEVPVESSLRLDAAPLIDGGRFAVELTLPKASAAHLAVYDVSGRRVAEHDTPTLAAGRHVIDFGATTGWGPGVYWVRLEGAASMLQRRVVLIR